MLQLDLDRIKYYPDRFYMNLEGFSDDELTLRIQNSKLTQESAIFIHEHFHYLTNISTFAGIRQFHSNFCDRFRIIAILANMEGIDSFPIKENTKLSSRDQIKYWFSVTQTLDDDSVNLLLSKETEKSYNKKFTIQTIEVVAKPMEIFVQGELVRGGRYIVQLGISGLIGTHSFNLTFGDLDEFLSCSIDEYLFEKDLANINPHNLNKRPFYPYRLYDEIIKFYGLTQINSFQKILIAYVSINAENPSVKLIEILENLNSNFSIEFQNNPEQYLVDKYLEKTRIDYLLNEIDKFVSETKNQTRKYVSEALDLYLNVFRKAQALKKIDYFYFIRPFIEYESNLLDQNNKIFNQLDLCIHQFPPKLVLRDGVLRYVNSNFNDGDATALIIATYEIFESLRTQKFAKRPNYLKEKYLFPDLDANCDDIESYEITPKFRNTFQLALNELGLLNIYLQEFHK